MTNVFTYKNSKGILYYLHSKQIKLRNGAERTIYYFAKAQKADATNIVPAGFRIKESHNGLPLLAKAEVGK